MSQQDSIYIASYSDLAILLLLTSLLFGLLIHFKTLWQFRILNISLIACMIGVSTGFLVVSDFSVLAIVLIALIQSYRFFSYLRIVKNRLNEHDLRRRSLRTEIVFSAFTSIVVILEVIIRLDNYSLILPLVALFQFTFAVLFLRKVNKTSKQTNAPNFQKHFSDEELPSVTIAIPARNETHDLLDCLTTVLQSNYPKMEVVVLDDCSQDATSDVIKSFSHKGVRFLEGTAPKGSWLSKNHAYQQLLDESEGKIILFCGVDVRFEKDSIRKLVETFIKTNNKMISVLPTRLGLHGLHHIVQPMRYWRELAIPRVFSKHPACLSTCWIADRRFIEKVGGFSAFKQNIKPEKHFAKRALSANAYAFYRSSSGFGISSIKNYKNQLSTAFRTRYPEHKKQPENVFMFTLWYFVIFFLPVFVAIVSILNNWWATSLLSVLSALILLYVHFKVDFLTNGQKDINRPILFPISIISEIFIINYSMWAYEFNEVLWKGRNICLPVLKVYSKLPKA